MPFHTFFTFLSTEENGKMNLPNQASSIIRAITNSIQANSTNSGEEEKMNLPSQVNSIFRSSTGGVYLSSLNDIKPQQVVPFNPQDESCTLNGFLVPCNLIAPFCGSLLECNYTVIGRPRLR